MELPRTYHHGDCADAALTHVPNKPENSSQDQFKSLTQIHIKYLSTLGHVVLWVMVSETMTPTTKNPSGHDGVSHCSISTESAF